MVQSGGFFFWKPSQIGWGRVRIWSKDDIPGQKPAWQVERRWLFLSQCLFHKLLSLKLPPCCVLWVCSFLSDRQAKVKVGGSRSFSFRIRQGVPQGSVLGQVLFILFVDDITKDFPWNAHVSLYAGDLAIWSFSLDQLKASSVVQSSLNVLEM